MNVESKSVIQILLMENQIFKKFHYVHAFNLDQKLTGILTILYDFSPHRLYMFLEQSFLFVVSASDVGNFCVFDLI